MNLPKHPTWAALPAAVAVTLVLAACVPKDFPEDPLFSPTGDLPEPRIAPVAPILGQTAATAEADRTGEARAELEQRGADLRSRADTLRQTDPAAP